MEEKKGTKVEHPAEGKPTKTPDMIEKIADQAMDMDEKKDIKANVDHPEEGKPAKTTEMKIEEIVGQIRKLQRLKREFEISRTEENASKKRMCIEECKPKPDMEEKKGPKGNVEHPEEVKTTKPADMIMEDLLGKNKVLELCAPTFEFEKDSKAAEHPEEVKPTKTAESLMADLLTDHQKDRIPESSSIGLEGSSSSSSDESKAKPDIEEKKGPKGIVEHPEEVKTTKTANMIFNEIIEELERKPTLKNFSIGSEGSSSISNDETDLEKDRTPESSSNGSQGSSSTSSDESQAKPDIEEKKGSKGNVEHPEEVQTTKTADMIVNEIIEELERKRRLKEGSSSIGNDKIKPNSAPKTFEFVGIKNQGATCYMNSVLQILYFTNLFRKALYMMPIKSMDINHCVAFALQRIFYDLQFSDKAVETTHLTKAFGWKDTQADRQHDVQEFLRTLLGMLEVMMRDTVVEGLIPRLFKGEMRSYIKCKCVDHESTRTESFYDIQLNIKGKKNLKEAFNDYVKAEVLDGDNKYDAGIHGLQEAEKGVMFTRFPPVLHLHLLRFQYDPINNCSVKFNDRFEFSEKLDLSEYLESENETCCTYTLQSVLVHIGHDNAGHYVVYIDPKGNGKWFKFNDSYVSECTKERAIQRNYGLTDEQAKNIPKEKAFSAYMLVYIQDSELVNVLQDVSIDDIPQHVDYNHPAYPKITVRVLLEDSFERHNGFDLFDPKTANYMTLRVDKTMTLHKFIESLAASMNYLPDNLRLWPIYPRNSNVLRPTYFFVEYELGQTIGAIADDRDWLLFIELLPIGSIIQHLPSFDGDWNVLLFFKVYDPKEWKISYCGHYYGSFDSTVADLIPILNERAGFPVDTKLEIYEEIAPGHVEYLTDLKNLFLTEARTGDILLFQKKIELEEEFEMYPFPTCIDFSRHYSYEIDIKFCDKMMLHGQFILQLSGCMSYNQMVKAVALHLQTEPCNLRFFHESREDKGPGIEIRRDFNDYIRKLFTGESQRTLYFEKVEESDKKVAFNVTFLKNHFRSEEEEIILYASQKSTVAELIQDAKIAFKMDYDGSRNFRLLDIKHNRINRMGPKEIIVDLRKSYRIEEIPWNELMLNEDEDLIPVSHFYKHLTNRFGSPFLVKIVNGETVSSLKEKLFQKVSIKWEVFQKLKIFVIYGGKPISITEDISVKIGGRSSDHPKIWIGIDHDDEE